MQEAKKCREALLDHAQPPQCTSNADNYTHEGNKSTSQYRVDQMFTCISTYSMNHEHSNIQWGLAQTCITGLLVLRHTHIPKLTEH